MDKNININGGIKKVICSHLCVCDAEQCFRKIALNEAVNIGNNADKISHFSLRVLSIVDDVGDFWPKQRVKFETICVKSSVVSFDILPAIACNQLSGF